MLALSSTTHHAVILSTTHHSPQHSTAQYQPLSNTRTIAPKLSNSQHRQIRRIIKNRQLTSTHIAKKAGCSKRTIPRLRQRMHCYNNTKAPSNRVGRCQSITLHVLNALCKKLLAELGLYQDKMARFVHNKFGIKMSQASVSRALASIKWLKKTTQQVAWEQNADLQSYYFYKVLQFRSQQLVFINESGCDKRISTRRTGWSPIGTSLVQVTRFHRDQRR
jgi:DNA-binding Xre family transcriptional regulator